MDEIQQIREIRVLKQLNGHPKYNFSSRNYLVS